MKKQILIVDDDPHIREVIQFALEKSGMAVSQAGDGREALNYLAANQADLIILDITMPEMDGLEVCKELRKTSDIPVLFLSSRDDEIDRVIGLEIGGDDYVTKPFSPRELVARVNAILKRAHKKSPAGLPIQKILNRAHVKLDIESHSAYWKDQLIALTGTEFMLLQTFLKAPGRTFTRDDLMNGAYERNIIVSDRTIDSHIRRLRSKYDEAGGRYVIETVHGVGYKLGTCA